MHETIDKTQQITSLASLAVFRELYNKQTDIYGIISEFLNDVISSHGKYTFTLTEITNLLNQSFGFSIPEAVVGTSLGRINHINKEPDCYVVDRNLYKENKDISELKQIQIQNSNLIVENLFSFISQEKNIELGDNEKEQIVQSFCSFLMDEANGEEYSEYVSGFIIANEQNETFRNNLAKIREGVILYSGLTHNTNLNEVGSWKTELNIFLDTEMLFHFAGYNGVLFKSIFEDFFKYVTEINNTGKKKLIRLKYFTEVRERIERFFTKAEYIVKGQDKPNPKMTAMTSLVEGCKDLSDVNEKKTDFFEFLKRNGIFEETRPSISNEENHLYNIINLEIIEEISKEFECDISENISILNYISMLRKDSNLNNFYNIAYLLLTGNSRTTRVAWHNKVKEEGNVPLATNLNWITNKFWFKLNKGFSKDAFPKSLDIITKAQTTLSSILNDSIGIKFDELKEQFAKGEITEEITKARLVNLRRQAIKPENIKQDEVKSILSTISEDSLERFVRDHEISKNEVHKKNQENIKLKAELEEKEREIIHTESARNKAEENLFNTSLSSLKILLKEKNEVVILLEKQKQSFDKIIKNQILFHKVILATSCVSYYIITFGLIYKYSWNQMEQWTYILNSAMPIILFFLYSLFFEKNLNPIEYVPLKREQITKKVYNQFNFDITKLHTLKRDVTELEEKIINTNNT